MKTVYTFANEELLNNKLKEMHESGKTWNSGDSFLDKTLWNENFAYNFESCCTAPVGFYRANGFTVTHIKD